jgi:hypothetical protein
VPFVAAVRRRGLGIPLGMTHDELPDTAMATGNDDGTPGEHTPEVLDEAEQEALDALRESDAPDVVTEAQEDDPAYARAVDDDTVAPG